ncbi:MAG: hypothetical protein AVO34_08920 [Firmicutes bacterium ML8_F2]|jgi:hypothetical protein|nr:MAG: hypothetical protein AVO34_08920 [Firmicutes bacterium ML8_F2]
MIRRFLNLFQQDLIIAARNALMWVLAGALVVIILVVLFAIPPDYELEDTYYFYDGSPQKHLEGAAREEGIAESSILGSLVELKQAVNADPQGIGIYFEDDAGAPRTTLFYRGSISEENLNLIAAAIEDPLRPIYTDGEPVQYGVHYLRPEAVQVPQNQNAVPPLLVFEVIVLGFLMAAVLLFQEKAEGTIRSYRVSPGGTAVYILSKAAVFAVVGLVYGLLMVLPTIAISVNYPALVLVIFFSSAIYTFLGLIVAVFFNNISEWLFVGIGLLMVNMAPIISYGWPSFAPSWLTWLPSYSIVFGLREILFPTGRTLLPLYLFLLVLMVVSYLACHLVVHHKLMKEGR